MVPTVNLHLFSVTHSGQGLDAVARAGGRTRGLGPALSSLPQVEGALVLSTCNRVDAYVDCAPTGADPVDPVRALLAGSGVPPTHREGQDALRHLFRTACGLDSMVVGEREIVGQLRVAADAARREGSLGGFLSRAVGRASAVSRQVARETDLADAGRSILSVALGLVEGDLPPLPACHVVLAGTGSYAGAAVAALRRRGVRDIAVHSATGRAARFADRHRVTALGGDTLREALARADLVVCCRGTGEPVLTADLLAGAVPGRRLVVLDLAVGRDVPQEVSDLPSVLRVGLDRVREAVPAADRADAGRAREIVEAGVGEFLREERARELDPAIVALRAHFAEAVEAEVGRMAGDGAFPAHDPGAERALRHLAACLVHGPSQRAHEAAAQGRSKEYLEALDLVLGIRPA